MSDAEPEEERQSKRDIVGSFFKEQAVKGTLLLKHSIGLGPQPNVVPDGPGVINGPLRTVSIGWHPVPLAGPWGKSYIPCNTGIYKIGQPLSHCQDGSYYLYPYPSLVAGTNCTLFAQQTGLGKLITQNINHYPDPTQHWAVLVDSYVHQLWMDESLDIIYINGTLTPSEWTTFPVGKTRFNDQALREAAEMTIHQMREARPAYNLISNNCQNFALNLLNAISIGGHREFATSFEVYQRATGKGSIKDLFKDDHPEEQQQEGAGEVLGEQGQQEQAEDEQGRPPRLQKTNTMVTAQQVMDEHTTKLDSHHHGAP